MNKKNTYIHIPLILLCITTAPSFYVFSSFRPAAQRGINYRGPRGPRQQPKKRVVQVQQPILTQQQIAAPTAAPITLDQTNMEQPQAEPTVVSQSIQAKAAPSSPGFLMTAYIVLLSTLNKAFGTGIELSYKPLMQNWMNREKVLSAKNAIPNQAKNLVESGTFDKDILKNAELIIKKYNIPEESPEYRGIQLQVNRELNLPQQQKVAITTEKMLKELEPLEKQTSFGSIASETLYFTLFNTAARFAGGLIGFGATMLLQNLMPKQGE